MARSVRDIFAKSKAVSRAAKAEREIELELSALKDKMFAEVEKKEEELRFARLNLLEVKTNTLHHHGVRVGRMVSVINGAIDGLPGRTGFVTQISEGKRGSGTLIVAVDGVDTEHHEIVPLKEGGTE